MMADDELSESAGEIGEGTEPSLRETLADAFDLAEGSGDSPAEAGPVRAAAEVAHDRQGRSAKPGDAPPTDLSTEPRTPSAPAAPPARATSAPPPSWSAAAKAKFAGLDPELQAEVLKRERDIEHGKAQWQQGAERLNRLDAILAPRSERFRLAGLDDVQAIQMLFAAQDFLDRDPVNALVYLGRQSGVDWGELVRHVQGDTAREQPQVPPGLAPLVAQVQSLAQAWAQRERHEAVSARAEQLHQVEAFASEGRNIYFDNVRERMGQLIRAGQASSLQEAYEQACWSDPQVRPLMIQSEDRERAAAAQAAARAKARDARHASGSVTGSPTPGVTSGGGPAPTLREELSRAFDAFAA